MTPVVDKLEARMKSGEPFTYGELVQLTGDAKDQGRTADKTIQKWRRKGWIAFVRVGRQTLWSLTDAGREMVKGASDAQAQG